MTKRQTPNPTISKEVVEYLNMIYPERCPTKHMSDREIWIAVGEREMVRHVTFLYEQQVQRGQLETP